jgi:hypothetical protein
MNKKINRQKQISKQINQQEQATRCLYKALYVPYCATMYMVHILQPEHFSRLWLQQRRHLTRTPHVPSPPGQRH